MIGNAYHDAFAGPLIFGIRRIKMADYRCPKHDVIFQTETDSRRPGSPASKDGKLPAHPENCHPDCPQAKKE